MNQLKTALYGISRLPYITGKRVKRYGEIRNDKNRIRKLLDQLLWLYREGNINYGYYMQGMDAKNIKITDYLGSRQLIRLQRKGGNLLKLIGGYTHSPDILTKDKFVFGSYIRSCGISAVESLFLIAHRRVVALGDYPNVASLPNGIYFAKNSILESGNGVVKFEIDRNSIISDGKPISEDTFLKHFEKGIWLIQPGLTSHKTIRKINGTALNTTRIYTMNSGNAIEYIGGFQAFATGNTPIDSWQHGSVYVAIDPYNDKLGKYGITNPDISSPGLLTKHPDSGIVFENYKIPFLKQSVELCIRAHRFLYGHFVIGWDVAITDSGPVIIEANEKPGINAVQRFTGGLKPVITEGLTKLTNWCYG